MLMHGCTQMHGCTPFACVGAAIARAANAAWTCLVQHLRLVCTAFADVRGADIDRQILDGASVINVQVDAHELILLAIVQ